MNELEGIVNLTFVLHQTLFTGRARCWNVSRKRYRYPVELISITDVESSPL